MTYYIKIGDNELQFHSAKEAVEELKEAVIVARLDADDEKDDLYQAMNDLRPESEATGDAE